MHKNKYKFCEEKDSKKSKFPQRKGGVNPLFNKKSRNKYSFFYNFTKPRESARKKQQKKAISTKSGCFIHLPLKKFDK